MGKVIKVVKMDGLINPFPHITHFNYLNYFNHSLILSLNQELGKF